MRYTHITMNEHTIAEMELSTEEIFEIVSMIYKDPATEEAKKETYKKAYVGFVERYPNIFEMACKPDFNFTRFEEMIKLKRSVNTGAMSQHDASVKVGNVLFDTYVKPKVQEKNEV